MNQNVSKIMPCKIGSLDTELQTCSIYIKINEENCCQHTENLIAQKSDTSAYAQLVHQDEHTDYDIVQVLDQGNEDSDYLQAIDQGNAESSYVT